MMFSELGKIFPIKPRHAEQSDTRQGIRRHEPEYEQRRRKKETKDEPALRQDGATVSVQALRSFLENFVRGEDGDNAPKEPAEAAEAKAAREPTDYKIQSEMPLGDEVESAEQSGEAAQAASAYQSMAHANERHDILLETTDQDASGPALDLSAADIRVIYVLIEDLKVLSEHQIEFLRIERAASFLDSLVNAVNKAKETL